MSHLDNSGSEDGQLRSPGDDLQFSGSEQGDTADSLDIKPPQATQRESRKKSGKEKKHSREHKHKNRDDRGERFVRDFPKKHDEERRRRHAAFGRGEQRERHNHRREQHYERQFDYHNRHKQRERDKRMDRNIRDRERRKYMEQQYESKSDAEKALEDLRSRLLSKRHKYEKDSGRYEEAGHYESASTRSSAHEYRKEHKERRENIIEVIDSPEHYSDFSASRKKEKKSIEDPELNARRAKLLEADREMARRKEVAREELEARRLRRGRDDQPSPVALKSKSKKRHAEDHRSRRKKLRISPKEEGEYDEKIHDISDDTGDSAEEDDKVIDSESEDKSDSDSDDSKASEKDNESPAEEELLPGSPLSAGELSKSEHRRSTSRSRTRSPSVPLRSRSHSERSKSGHTHSSKSKSRSVTPSESERSGSKSRSRSRSVSRPKSRSRSVSRSPSISRSRSPSPSSSDKEKDKKSRHNEEDDDDDDMLEIKDGDESEIKGTESKPSSIKGDDSPRDDKGEKLPNYFPGIQGCRSVEEFQCLNRIEEGTYGVVYRAKDKRTNEIVALKRLKMEKEKEGFPITSLREINTLLKGQHPNIVTVREIVVGSNMDKIFIVMDYVEHDLKSLMETMKHKEQSFFPGEVKCLLQQLLRAVAHLHDNWILHRDLKTSNLLLSHKGILKVGDFGLAREYGSPLKAYTSLVVTLWYRAPELLLCAKEYSTPIDMWSVGCIFAEFLQMGPLFPGKSEIDQLNRIFKELGTPNEKIWPGYKDLPAVQNLLSQNSHFTEYPVSNLRRRFFNKASELGISLLQGLLTYDPKQRLTAEQALKSPYFKELPLPIDPSMFPTWPAKSELGARKALASSPKPPSGGSQFKQLGRDEMTTTTTTNKTGFVLNAGIEQRQLAMGPGFNLKY